MDVATTVGIVSTLSGAAAVWYGIRRSRQVDTNTARSGDIAQIISALQEDNKAYRQEVKDIKSEVKVTALETKATAEECKERIVYLENKIASLDKRLNDFIKKYGNNE